MASARTPKAPLNEGPRSVSRSGGTPGRSRVFLGSVDGSVTRAAGEEPPSLRCDRGSCSGKADNVGNKSALRGAPMVKSAARALRPLRGNGVSLLHDEAGLRGQARGGPLRQRGGVLR